MDNKIKKMSKEHLDKIKENLKKDFDMLMSWKVN